MPGYLKNLVLTFLVFMSLVFSVLLYRGGWGNFTEVGLSNTHALTVAPYPDAGMSAAPYQIAIKSQKSVETALPGTQYYHFLMDKLSAMTVYDLRTPTTATESNQSITFDFGAAVSHDELVKFIPALETSTTPLAVRRVIIYLDSTSGKVRCNLTSSTQSYLATTDADADTFRSWVALSKALPQQLEWAGGVEQYVPRGKMELASSDWKVSTPSLLPLIKSFFVTPQAVTRIQSGQSTAIWTDGNRAVRMEGNNALLTYENPNTSMEPASSQTNVALTLGYIRDHGGSPPSSLLYQLGGSGMGEESSVYDLHAVYDGYPVLSQVGTYEVAVAKGRVVEFRRPVQELQQETARRTVSVFGYKHLRELIQKLSTHSPPSAFSVQLGYGAIRIDSQTVRLKPIYTVSNQGIVVWTIDAVTGQTTQGMDVK